MSRQRHSRLRRLPGFNCSRVCVYSITFCTHRRIPLLGEIIDGEMHPSEAGRIVESVWRDLPNHYPNIELDIFQLMPEHVHAQIAIIHPPDLGQGLTPCPSPLDLPSKSTAQAGLPEIVRALKSFSARRINALRGTPGAPVWQSGYHDYIVYNEAMLRRIRRYIANNPRRYTKKR